jgi:hypothetical protein
MRTQLRPIERCVLSLLDSGVDVSTARIDDLANYKLAR